MDKVFVLLRFAIVGAAFLGPVLGGVFISIFANITWMEPFEAGRIMFACVMVLYAGVFLLPKAVGNFWAAADLQEDEQNQSAPASARSPYSIGA